MSTKADFYVGRGMRSVYAGSVTHDAWPDAMQPYFAGVKTEAQFRAALEKVFADYGGIRPEYGWPWPWKDSRITDTAICLHGRQVWVKHWSGCWAPLARYSRPSRVKMRFPDMTRGPQTAERRLRRRISSTGGSFQVKADQDVLGALLVRLAYALTRFWMHTHRLGGDVVTLEGSDSTRWLLHDVLELLVREPDAVRELVAQRQAKEPHPAWDLLTWALEARNVTWMPDTVKAPFDYPLPMYFAVPTPTSIPRAQLPEGEIYFKRVDRQLYDVGMRHLEAAWAAVPFIYGSAVAQELSRVSETRITDQELESVAFLVDGTTHENRRQARELAGERFWGPCEAQVRARAAAETATPPQASPAAPAST